MKTTLMAVLAASTALIGLAGQASAQGRPPAPPMAAQKIKPDLYFITGGGGNSELLVTKSGALLVDDKYFAQPNYDAGVGGGSLLGLEHSLGEALKLKWDIAFPGHGEKPLTRDEVVDYKKKIDVLISRIRSAIDAGTPKSQLIQSLYTEDLGWKIGGTFWAPPERVDALVDELSKH